MEDRSSRRVRTLVTRMAHRGLSANEIARALISMMVGSNDKLQSETGYIDARPHPPDRRNLLQRTAGPYIRVKTGNSQTEPFSSGLPPDSGHSIIAASSSVSVLKKTCPH
jgi:hypothetical protein